MKRPWKPKIRRSGGPLYLSIADALATDVHEGVLRAGERLPPQRGLAQALGVDFTTVTRAYAEAQRRGLVKGRVGSGTYVASPDERASGRQTLDDEPIDLSVNKPPLSPSINAAFRRALAESSQSQDAVTRMLGYARHTDDGVRAAGRLWLEARGIEPPLERISVTAGAQHALSLLLTLLVKPGETAFAEILSYPGLAAAAAMAGVSLLGIEMDSEGVVPEALDEACRRHGARVLFCVPTFQNPTTAVMSAHRRKRLVEVARRRGLKIVEDDVCGPLHPERQPTLCELAPDIVTYIGSMSKSVATGLRAAFVVSPTPDMARALDAAVRATVLAIAPMSLAVAESFIRDGTAFRAIGEIRAEASVRSRMAHDVFEAAGMRLAAPPGSIHAWLDLPSDWSTAGLVAQAQQNGIRISPVDSYTLRPALGGASAAPGAVRLALGAEQDRGRLSAAIGTLAGILAQPPHLATSAF